MVIFNALLNLRELKELYSGKPVCICPLYKGSVGVTKRRYEATGNPVVIPAYVSLEKLNIKFSPKRAGTGDPSPENVRAITGWDSVKVTVSDKDESHDYDVTLPETIYGGTADGVTGAGEKTWSLVEFDGTENWEKNVNNIVLYNGASAPSNTNPGTGYCSHFPFTYNYGGDNIFISRRSIYLGVTLSAKYNLETWKSYLAAQASAGTPVQVAYKLAKPEPFKVSQVSIPSLIGENTFFTNGENMDIIYKKEYFWSDEA